MYGARVGANRIKQLVNQGVFQRVVIPCKDPSASISIVKIWDTSRKIVESDKKILRAVKRGHDMQMLLRMNREQ